MTIRRRPPNPSIKVANLEYAIPHPDAQPNNILEEIVWEKEREVEVARKKTPLDTLKSKINDLSEPKEFINALRNAAVLPAVIAEIKKASPSKGVIREQFDPINIAKSYEIGGASCLSVLTDKKFFQGGFDILTEVRKAVNLPLLCKDFFLYPYQIYQARASGADAILLIAGILSDQDLKYLFKVSSSLGMTSLVEVHDSKELERVLNIGLFPLIGINNRDLKTFKTDITVTKSLVAKYADKIRSQSSLVVSESGLFSRKDLDFVLASGAHAVLVGEALMKEKDIEYSLKALISPA